MGDANAQAMRKVTIRIETESDFRASEVVADLRNAAEVLYSPLRGVGFWDDRMGGMHPCTYRERGEACPHVLPPDSPAYIPYSETLGRRMKAVLEVRFPHAQVTIYLA
ncbi:MAG: hypothetical protein Q7T26_02055 [Dehalococcoidia bacterium]|nr:hypothetical protein [Dehalococcoidia bacterium]